MRMPHFISYPSGRCPASVWLENRHAASAEAGAAKPSAASGAAPLLSDETLDLLLLISCLPRTYHHLLMDALPALVASGTPPRQPVGRPAVHPQPPLRQPVGRPAVHPQPPLRQPVESAAPRPSYWRANWFRVSPLEFQRHRLNGLRARLRDELVAGLSIVATPLWKMGRAKRNQALAVRAEAIGQLAEVLRRCPGADPLEQELERALAHLRR